MLLTSVLLHWKAGGQLVGSGTSSGNKKKKLNKKINHLIRIHKEVPCQSFMNRQGSKG